MTGFSWLNDEHYPLFIFTNKKSEIACDMSGYKFFFALLQKFAWNNKHVLKQFEEQYHHNII